MNGVIRSYGDPSVRLLAHRLLRARVWAGFPTATHVVVTKDDPDDWSRCGLAIAQVHAGDHLLAGDGDSLLARQPEFDPSLMAASTLELAVLADADDFYLTRNGDYLDSEPVIIVFRDGEENEYVPYEDWIAEAVADVRLPASPPTAHDVADAENRLREALDSARTLQFDRACAEAAKLAEALRGEGRLAAGWISVRHEAREPVGCVVRDVGVTPNGGTVAQDLTEADVDRLEDISDLLTQDFDITIGADGSVRLVVV